MSEPATTAELVTQLSKLLKANEKLLATVESCTGGLVGAAIVEPDGASDVYVGGFITYSNDSKQQSVGVSPATLATYRAVSSQVAVEMAQGGYRKLFATNSIAITGVAGSGGGTVEKPVGTVWICVATNAGQYDCRRFLFPDDGRTAIRECALRASLMMCIQQLKSDYQQLEHERDRLTA